jgi:hypothetical protein
MPDAGEDIEALAYAFKCFGPEETLRNGRRRTRRIVSRIERA